MSYNKYYFIMQLFNLTSNEKSLKDYVIDILSAKWPLSVRKIYNDIKNKYGKHVTYQAVYKTVQQLCGQNVLIKQDRDYGISLDWIRQAHKILDDLQSAYVNKQPLPLAKGIIHANVDGDTTTLVFETVLDWNNYNFDLEKSESGPVCSECRHLWWPLFKVRETSDFAKYLGASNSRKYTICRGNTETDKWCAEMEQHMGFNTITGIDCSHNCDVCIVGDYVVEIYYPEDVLAVIEKTYNAAKGIHEIDLGKLYREFLEKKTQINVVIHKNTTIAERIREQILSHFKKKHHSASSK
jgi:hypothetical protein